MRIFRLLTLFIIATTVLTSCSNDGRMVKKFIARLNAHEYNASSKYIYPGDHPKLYLYCQVAEKSPNLGLKLLSKKDVTINNTPAVIVELEYSNSTLFYINYMKEVGRIRDDGNTIIDTIYIREVDGREYISFNWATISGESLKSATIGKKDVNQMNIRAGMGTKFPVVGKLNAQETVIIDDYSENNEWVKCVAVDQQCRVLNGLHIQEFTIFYK